MAFRRFGPTHAWKKNAESQSARNRITHKCVPILVLGVLAVLIIGGLIHGRKANL